MGSSWQPAESRFSATQPLKSFSAAEYMGLLGKGLPAEPSQARDAHLAIPCDHLLCLGVGQHMTVLAELQPASRNATWILELWS